MHNGVSELWPGSPSAHDPGPSRLAAAADRQLNIFQLRANLSVPLRSRGQHKKQKQVDADLSYFFSPPPFPATYFYQLVTYCQNIKIEMFGCVVTSFIFFLFQCFRFSVFSAQTVLVFRVAYFYLWPEVRADKCFVQMSHLTDHPLVRNCTLLTTALSCISCCFAGPSPPPCTLCCICLPLSDVRPILLSASSMSKGPTSDIPPRENVRSGFGWSQRINLELTVWLTQCLLRVVLLFAGKAAFRLTSPHKAHCVWHTASFCSGLTLIFLVCYSFAHFCHSHLVLDA